MPELAFDLFKTHDYVKSKLEDMGYQTKTVAKTGLIAVKEGLSKKAVAFRSDMDALPVDEKTGVSFASTHKGKMHACGHDGHMSMLLGFAAHVSKIKQLNETVVFIFQPAEEGPGGAKIIIEEGLFETYDIKKIFGLHLYPGLQEGIYGLVKGPMMAQNGEFDIVIDGTSAHGAQPHLGVDAIVAGMHLVQMYHQIISRSLNPLEPAVITVGTIHGGEARNIIANQIRMSGTIRAFNQDTYQMIKDKMKAIDSGVERLFGVNVDAIIRDCYPPVVNDANLFETVKGCLESNEYEVLKPMMFAEDFAFYQRVVPGLFVMLGSRNETREFVHPLHSCFFNFNEDILVKGVELYVKIGEALGLFD
ncbi:MAG: amidohydrolase [Acholeplasmataceae bacterium]|nr:amidohydrolase [Acholeplasmataceae bacterium]